MIRMRGEAIRKDSSKTEADSALPDIILKIAERHTLSENLFIKSSLGIPYGEIDIKHFIETNTIGKQSLRFILTIADPNEVIKYALKSDYQYVLLHLSKELIKAKVNITLVQDTFKKLLESLTVNNLKTHLNKKDVEDILNLNIVDKDYLLKLFIDNGDYILLASRAKSLYKGGVKKEQVVGILNNFLRSNRADKLDLIPIIRDFNLFLDAGADEKLIIEKMQLFYSEKGRYLLSNLDEIIKSGINTKWVADIAKKELEQVLESGQIDDYFTIFDFKLLLKIGMDPTLLFKKYFFESEEEKLSDLLSNTRELLDLGVEKELLTTVFHKYIYSSHLLEEVDLEVNLIGKFNFLLEYIEIILEIGIDKNQLKKYFLRWIEKTLDFDSYYGVDILIHINKLTMLGIDRQFLYKKVAKSCENGSFKALGYFFDNFNKMIESDIDKSELSSIIKSIVIRLYPNNPDKWVLQNYQDAKNAGVDKKWLDSEVQKYFYTITAGNFDEKSSQIIENAKNFKDANIDKEKLAEVLTYIISLELDNNPHYNKVTKYIDDLLGCGVDAQWLVDSYINNGRAIDILNVLDTFVYVGIDIEWLLNQLVEFIGRNSVLEFMGRNSVLNFENLISLDFDEVLLRKIGKYVNDPLAMLSLEYFALFYCWSIANPEEMAKLQQEEWFNKMIDNKRDEAEKIKSNKNRKFLKKIRGLYVSGADDVFRHDEFQELSEINPENKINITDCAAEYYFYSYLESEILTMKNMTDSNGMISTLWLPHTIGEDGMQFLRDLEKEIQENKESTAKILKNYIIHAVRSELLEYANFIGVNISVSKIIRDFEIEELHRAATIFRGPFWLNVYGGELWAQIAEAGLALWQSDKWQDAWIDHIFDLEHNSGAIFDKANDRIYQNDTDLKRILGKKRDATSFKDAAAFYREFGHDDKNDLIEKFSEILRKLNEV